MTAAIAKIDAFILALLDPFASNPNTAKYDTNSSKTTVLLRRAAPVRPRLALLYPLYEINRGLISNSYAIRVTLATRANLQKKRHELGLQR